jgi:putative peptide zinc metalloprotease protein
MPAEQAKLRDDLIISPNSAAVVVKDPTTRRFYRFGEVEYFILQQLDGVTPAHVIRQRVEAKFNGAITSGQIEQFIARLQQFGLAERDVGPYVTRASYRHQRLLGTPLYLRFKAFDPDRLFDRLVPYMRPCFTLRFVVLSTALITAGAGIQIVHWEQLKQDFQHIYRLDTLLILWLTVLLVSVMHEFAHGLTCKHFGGEVREIGFMLIFFQPAFYCNVSDAWLFPQKARRIFVTLAGPYFELVIWALATLFWRLTGGGTAIGNIALVVLATSGIRTLWNFNPLLKFDGYYLLSDYLEIPNLRSRSFAYLRSRLQRVWRRTRPTTIHPTSREQRIYLAYGLLAGAYSVWLLASVTGSLGRFLVDRYGLLGFVMLGGFLTALFWYPLKAEFPKMLALLRGRRLQPPAVTGISPS